MVDRKHEAATAEEARHVAEEAVEAAQHGDFKEARFLAEEAAALDADAAREVLDAAPAPVPEPVTEAKR